MYFLHSDDVWQQFPQLRALVAVIRGSMNLSRNNISISGTIAEVTQRLQNTQESDILSIQAWRKAYSAMGLKPTQYRCAAEALLRRLRKDGTLPELHPLVDILNAESVRAAVPIAAFDVDHIVWGMTVRPAQGDEIHETFQGEVEHPAPGEIIFADAAGQAHSRRWVHRQGAVSAVNEASNVVLVVAEALHDNAIGDLTTLKSRLEEQVATAGLTLEKSAILGPEHRRFDYGPG